MALVKIDAALGRRIVKHVGIYVLRCWRLCLGTMESQIGPASHHLVVLKLLVRHKELVINLRAQVPLHLLLHLLHQVGLINSIEASSLGHHHVGTEP